MQEWVRSTGAKVCVVLEGRDTAGEVVIFDRSWYIAQADDKKRGRLGRGRRAGVQDRGIGVVGLKGFGVTGSRSGGS